MNMYNATAETLSWVALVLSLIALSLGISNMLEPKTVALEAIAGPPGAVGPPGPAGATGPRGPAGKAAQPSYRAANVLHSKQLEKR